MKKGFLGCAIGLVLLCFVAASGIEVSIPIAGRVPAGSSDLSGPGSNVPKYESGVPGAAPPRRGNCGNVSQVYPENPFEGWPAKFHAGDWRTMSAWFCDPRYLIDWGADHWGIDLASLVEVSTTPEGLFSLVYTSMYQSQAIATVKKDTYGVVSSANAGGYNFGMGSHVKIMALACEQRCGKVPDESELEPGEYVWELEEEASQCPGQPPPVPQPEPPKNKDLLLFCEETGWVATYMHFEVVLVEKGQLIERGTVLGTVDSTGNSSGHHLHYQINAPGLGAVDPAPTLCAGYSPALRMTNRAHRGSCGGD